MRRACLNVIPKTSAICSHHSTAIKHDLNFIVSLGEKQQLFLAPWLQISVIRKAIIISWSGVSEEDREEGAPTNGSRVCAWFVYLLSQTHFELWSWGGLSAVSSSLQAHTVPSALMMVVRSHGVLPKQALRGTITYLLIWLWSYTYY